MRSTALFLVFGLCLLTALAVPVNTAGSLDSPAVSQTASPIEKAASGTPGTSSVRMKVSTVTYAGSMGQRVDSSAGMSGGAEIAPAGRVQSLRASELPGRIASAAPATVVSRVALPETVSGPSLSERVSSAPRKPLAAVLGPVSSISSPALPLSRLPGGGKSDALAARGCAKRLIALVEDGIRAGATSRSMAV